MPSSWRSRSVTAWRSSRRTPTSRGSPRSPGPTPWRRDRAKAHGSRRRRGGREPLAPGRHRPRDAGGRRPPHPGPDGATRPRQQPGAARAPVRRGPVRARSPAHPRHAGVGGRDGRRHLARSRDRCPGVGRRRGVRPGAGQRRARRPVALAATGYGRPVTEPTDDELTQAPRGWARRAPRYGPFVASGALVGFVVAAVLAVVLPPVADHGTGAVLGYLGLVLALVGGLVGAAVAVVLDRRAR